ncbi:MAG: hypothetical protein PHH08_04885 [Candidatus ainarchaeum sp.]|nr:hypothetical protein [Candidatus ainarchaeum sp.]
MKKAQILSIDLLIALIAVVFSIGLLLQYSETMIYSQKEKYLQNELERAGKTASMLLVSNPEITCRLVDSGGATLDYMQNCIDSSGNYSKLNMQALGIQPDRYGFAVYSSEIKIFGDDFPSPAPANVYSEKRVVAARNSGNLTKADLETCIGNVTGQTCGNKLLKEEMVIYVWRK